MRRLRRLLPLAPLLVAGCGAAPEPLRGYLEDRALRRQALEDALWFRDNDYARLRLRRFASGDAADWQRLPEWTPPAAPLRLGAAEAPRPLAVELPPEASEGLEAALLRLGEAAFFDYPAQLVAGFELVERTPALAAGYGLWRGAAPTDPAGAAPRLGGLLRVQVSGGTALALSCAACHAAEAEGRVEPGRPGRLDIGALSQDQAPPGVTLPAAAWGPGRLDVSPDGEDNPSAIPDLRVVALQRHLQHGATLRQGEGPLSLAVRIETLLITSLGEGVRPPPPVALGLALYLRSLLPPPAQASMSGPPPRGRALFAARCAGCHGAPDGAGEPVALASVGTDGTLARSRERGTGSYRTPTLRRVAERGPLLHDGRAADLAALLDGARLRPDHPGGAVPGHAFGLDLPPEVRADLAAYVSSL